MKSLLWAAVFLALGAGISASGDEKAPNVLFIISDDLSTALSGYGDPHCQTPNLDRLAARGVSFSNAYCQFPLCGPSRASLFSGQYPLTTGILKNNVPLPDATVTLSRHFLNHGYWSGRVGKIYHMDIPHHVILGHEGADHPPSWTEAYNIRALETFHPGRVRNVTSPQTVELYPELQKQWDQGTLSASTIKKLKGGHVWVIVETDEREGELADTLAVDQALRVLQKRAQELEPFFLAVGLIRPHFPFIAPTEHFAAYPIEDMPLPEVSPEHLKTIPQQEHRPDLKVGQRDRQEIRQAYYASISYMDEEVGRLLDEVDRLSLRDDTLIVFVSDHGYLLGEQRTWQKNQLWEEATRVPLIISAPGQKVRGETSDEIVELIDLYPTLVDLAGLPPQPAAQGVSLRPLLEDPTGGQLSRQEAFLQTKRGFGLRHGQWSYMWYPPFKKHPEGAMLYDMEADPKQTRNLAVLPEWATLRDQLHERLLARIEMAQKTAHR
ncbi:MAG: sulfatase [Verrucomicrobiota bacterium]